MKLVVTHPSIRVLFFALLLSTAAFGQNSATTASIEGTVRDTAGKFVPNASVAAKDIATGQIRNATTDSDGVYRLPALAVSTYELRITSPGFADFTRSDVTLTLAQTMTLDVTLQPAGVNSVVEVSDNASDMDPSETAVATSITTENVEELPVKDRNYLQFALVAPGVAPSNTHTPTGAGGALASPLEDSGFSFGGLRTRSNSIVIDGLTNIDETTGAALVALSPEIVREFQVVNNGISAEFGGAAGGTINVITKTGSNQYHGTLFTFFQNQRFDARNPFDAKRRLYHAYQPGFSLGGPLRKDRLFFYVSAEQEHQISNDEPEIARSIRTQINTALGAGFAPRLAVRSLQGSTFRSGRDQTEAAGKLTWIVDKTNTANFRFAFTNNRERADAFDTTTLDDPSSRGSVYSKDYQVTASLSSVLNPAAINEARFQVSQRSFISRAGDQTGPEI
ncbi:MAG: carboxypeptidase regulatory-like domain-containing protein, partial [Acidobacteria bacterium]|nr:carboxypeptidase regulatory-like domain-containing protein [Acidobacteriota bacterium]